MQPKNHVVTTKDNIKHLSLEGEGGTQCRVRGKAVVGQALPDNAPAKGHLAAFTTVRGFTLIELLVVVLIIGILAAIAVPQYQKAVAKSRYAQLQTAGDAFIKAYKAYYLANGQDPETLDELDFLPFSGTFYSNKKAITNGKISCDIGSYHEFYCSYPGTAKFLYSFPTYASSSGKDKRLCRATSDFERKVCISVGGVFWRNGSNSSFTDYYLP